MVHKCSIKNLLDAHSLNIGYLRLKTTTMQPVDIKPGKNQWLSIDSKMKT